MPLSVTASFSIEVGLPATSRISRLTASVTLPVSVNFRAFESKLLRICSTFTGSPQTLRGVASSKDTSRSMPLSAACTS